ncbi:MAG: putative Ntn-hydrolase superfamily protein [Saprospiraceae bacterium]|jgi:uncharacterized Ntn-hydrolase superfamily protein
MIMKTSLIVLFFSFTFCNFLASQHTFSIVAVDSITGEIGSAGATCIAAENGAITISDIILGKGAIHTQSYWTPQNQSNARIRMQNGDSPQEIIDWLVQNDIQNNPALRQYNIVDLNNGNPRSAGYTGVNCFDKKIHITGSNYAIAGNILISEDVVKDMETQFLVTSGTLADKLMAAMQGAKRPGADERCLVDGISSASAFLRVAQPTDTDASLGNLSLDLNVWLTNNIFEPIDVLQNLYDKTTTSNDTELEVVKLYPNPSKQQIIIDSKSTPFDSYIIYDINGRKVVSQNLTSNHNFLSINIQKYNQGYYTISLRSNEQLVKTLQFQVIK